MNKKLIVWICLILFSVFKLQAQNPIVYPKGDFINPLDIPLSLAGNFGELRSNHFHSGFDFRTNGEEGYPVKAVADGYVSRIKVSAYGYGNALYITHKNGYVSVYGHLQRYDSIISQYLFKRQYELELFEVDLFPQKNEIQVMQGQVIGISGNTGGSEGPHLHFEIRDEKTEEVINPYYFGFVIPDTIPPSIEGIAIYPLEPNATINGSNKVRYLDVKKLENNQYTLNEKLTLSGKIGFGLITFDKENGSINNNGTNAYQLSIDSATLFLYLCQKFTFDQTRYINAHIDYAKLKKSKEKFQRCYLLPGNKINHYVTAENEGAFEFKDTLNHFISIKASDFNNNSRVIEFTCKSGKPSAIVNSGKDKNYFAYTKEHLFEKEDVIVKLPSHCLYDNIAFKYVKTIGSAKFLSAIHQIHEIETPVHIAYSLSIKPSTKGIKFKDKLLIVNIDDEGNTSSEGGNFENGFVVTKTKSFGNFALMLDTVAPSIKILNFEKAKSVFKQDKIVVKIGDNLSGIKTYRGTIDGAWVLMQHDNKEKTLTYYFDEKLVKTNEEHIFVIILVDKKNNSKKISTKFTY